MYTPGLMSCHRYKFFQLGPIWKLHSLTVYPFEKFSVWFFLLEYWQAGKVKIHSITSSFSFFKFIFPRNYRFDSSFKTLLENFTFVIRFSIEESCFWSLNMHQKFPKTQKSYQNGDKSKLKHLFFFIITDLIPSIIVCIRVLKFCQSILWEKNFVSFRSGRSLANWRKGKISNRLGTTWSPSSFFSINKVLNPPIEDSTGNFTPWRSVWLKISNFRPQN